jgi:putative FmdB family regulatory protein
MPLYAYDCLDCEAVFELRHPYGKKDILCAVCDSENIVKNLSSSVQRIKKMDNIKSKTGDEVKKAIESGKQDLEEYKKTKKDRVYDKK